MKASC